MNEYKIIGIDLAKDVFQVCALNQANKVQLNKPLTRKKLNSFMHQLQPTLVAMEACGSANHWGRKFRAMGHEVRLVPAQYVKPFTQGNNKNDTNDALAICEAALRPKIHFVPIKSQEAHDLQMLHRIRQRQVESSTAVINQIRAYLRENGITISISVGHLQKALPDILEDADNGLTILSRELINDLYLELLQIRSRKEALDTRLKQMVAQNHACQRLLTIPGIGPIIASALVAAVGNAAQFRNGRQMAAWAGLVPRHTGTGGKVVNQDTSKAGNPYLRYLLIHGARTIVKWCHRRDDNLSRWVNQLVTRRGKNKATVALANKMTRIAWVLLTRDEDYQMKHAFK